MNIGDTFVDPQKRTWTIESDLGHGTWGRTLRAKAENGQQCVVKIALRSTDFPSDTPLPDGLVQACRDAAHEQIALLEKSEHPFLPRLLCSFTTDDGAPVLMLAPYDSLERRVGSGHGLATTIDLLARLARALGKAGFVHGALRPSNILVNERGEPVVSDPVTPALRPILDRLEQLSGVTRWRPPEADSTPRSGWDTWALCQCLYQAALHREIGSEARPADQGLDKVEIATLKDRALARLKQDRTNPRFQSRMADRLGALLHRGLSLPVEPSPPYRFVDCNVLADRLDEVVAMIEPHVVDVGRLLPPAESVSGVFRGDKPVDFSVSVGCSAGVTNHEDVVCGLKLVDLDVPDERVPLPEATYKVERHRSGRLRFQFSLPDLPPGRYRLKIAFTVRDAGTEPQVAGGEFEVRPPPGYVPPAPQLDQKAPIVLDRIRHSPVPEAEAPPSTPGEGPRIHGYTTDVDLEDDDLAPVTGAITLERPSSAGLPSSAGFPTAAGVPSTGGVPSSGPYSTAASDPGSDAGAEIIEGLFPRPIAPPTDQPATSVPVQQVRHVPAESGVSRQPQEPIRMPQPAVASAGAASWAGPTTSGGSAGVASSPGLAMPNISIGRSSGPAAPPPAAPEPPSPGPDAGWFSGHLDDFGLEGDGLLPGIHDEGEELPDWNPEGLGDKLRAIPGFDAFFEWMQRDAYTAFVAAAAGSFLLLLLMMAMLKAI